MAAIDTLAQDNYISLTTFKRDGTGVATPVWVTREGDHLYVITDSDSGKAKRLRNFSRVMVAPCDMRGRVTGASVDATAELLDEERTGFVMGLITEKYGWQARVATGVEWTRKGINRLLRRPTKPSPRVGIRITLTH